METPGASSPAFCPTMESRCRFSGGMTELAETIPFDPVGSPSLVPEGSVRSKIVSIRGDWKQVLSVVI